MAIVQRYDVITIGATRTNEGWIKDAPIVTRSGVFEYHDAKGKLIREYRPPEEVFNEMSLASLAAIPITDGHHGIVTADNSHSIDILGTVISKGVQDGDNVTAEIVIHNTKRLGSRRELSLGYHAEVVQAPGVTPTGEHYDSIQRGISYNHLAIVNKGRAGNARLRLDGADASSFVVENDMIDPAKVDVARLVTVRLDQVDYAAAQEVANALARLQREVDEKEEMVNGSEAERDILKGQVAEAAQILAQAVMDAKNEVRARIALEQVAIKYGVKVEDSDTDRQLREKVVTKLSGPSIKMDGKSDDYVTSAFDLALDGEANKVTKLKGQVHVLADSKEKGSEQLGGAAAARARLVDHIRAGRSG